MSQGPSSYPLLSTIETPADLRALPEQNLPALADELRQFLIQTVSTRGGHFAAGLGTVELTIALHYVFNTPEDRLVWDVGHQAYPHKVLTGRRDRLHSIKQRGGLAPFPVRAESPYDTFGVGHSSTSIRAALGMAIAAARQGTGRRAVAVIGDGAMSAGMAFEALNHAGSLPVDLLVVLNDNDMSISENVGALSNYLARVISGPLYAQLRESGRRALRQMPAMRRLARRSEEHLKGMVLPGTLFEEMGFNYVGPIDGHDLGALLRALRTLRGARGPQLLHLVTAKGKGYAPAEADPITWHGPGPFDPVSGAIRKEKAGTPSYSEVFGQWLCDIAERDPRIVAITPAMREGSALVEYSRRFPERYFDVAIAEQHAVTFAAGLAADGMRPVVAIYSTFLQRGYDQLIHDVALQNLPVLFAIDRAGFVGSDGATHHGSYDLSYLRCIPNMVVMAPATRMSVGRCSTPPPSGTCRLRCAIRAAPDRVLPSTRSSPRWSSAVPKYGAAAIADWHCWRSAACSAARCVWPSAWTPRSSTCASSSRSIWRCCARSPRRMLRSSRLRRTWSPAAPAAPAPRLWTPRDWSCRGCTSAFRTASSSTAAAMTAWPPPVWTSPASPPPSMIGAPAIPALKPSRAATKLAAASGSVMSTAVKPKVATVISVEDVQSRADTRRLPINRVGIKDIRHPVRVKDRSSGEQHTVATFNMYVNLPHNFKGTHMSRFVEVLHQEREISVDSFQQMLSEMTTRLDAEAGHIEMSFPYFVMKRAPVSGVESLMDYQASLIGEIRQRRCQPLAQGGRAGHEPVPLLEEHLRLRRAQSALACHHPHAVARAHVDRGADRHRRERGLVRALGHPQAAG